MTYDCAKIGIIFSIVADSSHGSARQTSVKSEVAEIIGGQVSKNVGSTPPPENL